MTPPPLEIQWSTLIAIAVGGAVGAVLRHFTSFYSAHLGLWSSTILVNMSGSFLLGFLVVLPWDNNSLSPVFKMALTTGLLGAFTTFSTFSVENAQWFQRDNWTLLSLNILLQVLGGVAMALLGIYLGNRWNG